MAYSHQQQEMPLVQAVSAADANPLAGSRVAVGYLPPVVRAIYAVVTTAIATATLTLTFKYRPTPGSATGEVSIGTLTLPVAAAVGKSYYKDGLNVKIPPGAELVVQSSGGATGNVSCGVLVEPSPEHPDNNTNMIASA